MSNKTQKDFYREHYSDFLVVGGGLAGTAAAIAAARCGLRTILIQNRPVLGGPAGSECDSEADGSIIGGAFRHRNRNARETGIIEEWRQEAAFRMANGWRNHWSIVMRETCEREKNLTLLLNTEAYEVETEKGLIKSVTARTIGSELTHKIYAPLFADCSGDAFLGFAAGAEFRMGREGQQEFGESMALEEPDDKTMGSSIFFRAVDVGRSVPFVPPEWACRFESDDDLPFRNHTNITSGYWWLEYGGELDTIADNEVIYRKLLSILYGVWDHIKNHGGHGAENYAINWVANFPGKRESRRLMGDYILNQNDLIKKPDFPDTITYGGWHIDQHPIGGLFSPRPPDRAGEHIIPGRYPIPFRCLYSRNIENLLMAGRNISASHIALGSTRVMATCATMGQVIGTAAFLCKKHAIKPKAVTNQYITDLQALLYKHDHAMIDRPVSLFGNLAKEAAVTASSSMSLKMIPAVAEESLSSPRGNYNTDFQCGQMFNVSSDRIDAMILKMNNRGTVSRTVSAYLRKAQYFGDFSNKTDIAIASVEVPPGMANNVRFDFNTKVNPGSLYFVLLDRVHEIDVCLHRAYYPGLYHNFNTIAPDNLNFCMEVEPKLHIWGEENAVSDHVRPGNWSNIWISDPEQPLPQELSLRFNNPIKFNTIELTFDTNLDIVDHTKPASQCVRDYRIEIEVDKKWKALEEIKNNCFRFRRHRFSEATASAIKLVVTGTHGDPSARVFQIRVFETNQ